MKMLIQIVLVALVVGGLSAGGSYYYHQKFRKPEPVAEKPDEEEKSEADEADMLAEEDSEDEPITTAKLDQPTPTEEPQTPESSSDTVAETKPEPIDDEPLSVRFGPPAGIRPPWNINGDEAGDLINDLRNRAVAATRQERRLAEREEAMKLIVDDLSFEQKRAKAMRKRLVAEANRAVKVAEETQRATALEREAIYRASKAERDKMREEQSEVQRDAELKIEIMQRDKEEAIDAAERAMKMAQEQLEDVKKQLDETRKPPEARDRSASPEETANVQKLISVIEKMSDDIASQALQGFVDTGRTEAVILILNGLQPKKAAKILALIQEEKPETAADLLVRLKNFKKSDASREGTPTK